MNYRLQHLKECKNSILKEIEDNEDYIASVDGTRSEISKSKYVT